MIQTTQLSKKYGQAEVLNIESLEIPKGQSFGLVGNNGAGKTTYFNILLDLIRPTTGSIINNEITVNQSEDWKTFTGSFIDESFVVIACITFCMPPVLGGYVCVTIRYLMSLTLK